MLNALRCTSRGPGERWGWSRPHQAPASRRVPGGPLAGHLGHCGCPFHGQSIKNPHFFLMFACDCRCLRLFIPLGNSTLKAIALVKDVLCRKYLLVSPRLPGVWLLHLVSRASSSVAAPLCHLPLFPALSQNFASVHMA